MQWQPIETAPKDATVVKLKCEGHPEYGEHIMRFNPGRGHWEGRYYGPLGVIGICWAPEAAQPTHWMPLPEPPTGDVDER